MLVWVLLVVLAACAAVSALWPLDPGMIEIIALVSAGALFMLICAIEARH